MIEGEERLQTFEEKLDLPSKAVEFGDRRRTKPFLCCCGENPNNVARAGPDSNEAYRGPRRGAEEGPSFMAIPGGRGLRHLTREINGPHKRYSGL